MYIVVLSSIMNLFFREDDNNTEVGVWMRFICIHSDYGRCLLSEHIDDHFIIAEIFFENFKRQPLNSVEHIVQPTQKMMTLFGD